MTDEIAVSIEKAKTITELDDIYRPYRPKRRTRATIAKEKGLGPLADIIWLQETTDQEIDRLALDFINEDEGIKTSQEAIGLALDIIAEKSLMMQK